MFTYALGMFIIFHLITNKTDNDCLAYAKDIELRTLINNYLPILAQLFIQEPPKYILKIFSSFCHFWLISIRVEIDPKK